LNHWIIVKLFKKLAYYILISGMRLFKKYQTTPSRHLATPKLREGAVGETPLLIQGGEFADYQ